MPSQNPSPSAITIPAIISLSPGFPVVDRFAKNWVNTCKATSADDCAVFFRGTKIAQQNTSTPPQKASLASCTKSIVGVAAFKMKELGLVNLDVKVHTIMPEWEDWQRGDYRDITLRHLLTQRSGLPGNQYFQPENGRRYIRGDDQFFNHFEGPDDLNLRASLHHVQHTPGTCFDYSNPASQLASAVLERILMEKRGESLATFAQRAIFEPLKMHNSRLSSLGNVTLGYSAMESTAHDLGQLGMMILGLGQLDGVAVLNPDSIFEMLSLVSPFLGGSWYTHMWWAHPNLKFLAAAGDRNNLLIICPEHNLVLSRIQEQTNDDASLIRSQGKLFWDRFGTEMTAFQTDFAGSTDNPLSSVFCW